VQPQPPVVRSYKGPDRHAAEEAYRVDARQAAGAGWVPVAHRWTEDAAGAELSVVFELREPETTVDVEPEPEVVEPEAEVVEPEVVEPEDEVVEPVVVEPEAEVVEPEVVEPEVVEPEDDMAGGEVGVGEPDSDAELTPLKVGLATSTPSSDDESSVPTAASAARAHARSMIQVLDLHCAGEPLRLIRSGYPQVPFAPILERRRWVQDHADDARRTLMFEPRGHRDMYGAVLLPPFGSDADIAVLFMHNAGYSTMCGHGIICLTAGLIEERLYPATEPQTVIRWETPAGLVTATADVTTAENGGPEVAGVRFVNVPSYLHAADIALRSPDLELVGPAAAAGSLRVQLAFGGAYYGIVDAADLGLRVVPGQVAELTRAGALITELLRRDHRPSHPTHPELGFVYGTIIVDHDPATSPDGRAAEATLRNVTIFADAEVDRSPCGSGTSALLAWLLASGHVAIGQDIVNAGITGEAFRARVEERTTLGVHDAVITSVAGMGYVTGYATYVVDDRDALGDGFLLR
jgi:proline racemase